MHELKPLSRDAVPGPSKGRTVPAAERARGGREHLPDILKVDPENQKALVTLLLALSDGFEHFEVEVARALAVLPRLRASTRGLLRGARPRTPGQGHFRGAVPARASSPTRAARAMAWYEKAEAIRPPATTTRSCAGTPARGS